MAQTLDVGAELAKVRREMPSPVSNRKIESGWSSNALDLFSGGSKNRVVRNTPAPLEVIELILLALLVVGVGACPAWPGRVTVRESDEQVLVQLGAMRLTVGRETGRWGLRGPAGVSVEEPESGGLFYERGGVVHEVTGVEHVEPLPDGARIELSTDEGLNAALVVRFLSRRTLEIALEPPQPESVVAFGDRLHSPDDEVIYGLTERLRDSPLFAPPLIPVPSDDIFPPEVGTLDRRGEVVEMRVVPTLSLYAPFYQTSRGYGLSVAGTTFGHFDLANSEPEAIGFRFEAATAPEDRRFVFHVIVGPGHRAILDEYTGVLVGRPFVPPDWAFLHWRWRDELEIGAPALLDGVPVNAQVAEDVLRYEEFGIPPGVYLFDRPAFPGNFGFARWEWDEVRLPNPDAMLASLRQRGYRLGLWSSTWTCGNGPDDNGTEAQLRGYLAPGPGGSPNCANTSGRSFILDVTNPSAIAWWRDRVADFAGRYGIQAIKLDRGEEHIPSGTSDIWYDGRNGREVHNAYITEQTVLHHDALAQAFPDGDFVVMTRSGYADTAAAAVFWGGDIAGSEFFGFGPGTDLGLRSAIISQLRAAFMGMPIWGSDTGGYYEFKDREVFARWIEFSTFSGIMEIGGKGTRAPWDMPTEPSFDAEMIEIYRRYTRLRAVLQPYIVAAAREAHAGMPIARPMPFFDRHDPELLDRWDQYLFGPDLLVAPVWRIGQREREVYFPRGIWRSYWDKDEVHHGPGVAMVAAPLDVIPVFVRGRARLPGPDESAAGVDWRRERTSRDRR